jgi:hypothetical protein
MLRTSREQPVLRRRRLRILACALLVLPGSVGVACAQESVVAEGWASAQRQFAAWQAETLAARAGPTEEMKRIFYQKVEVPVPAAGGEAGTVAMRPVRFDSSLFDPLGILPGAPDIVMSMGDPSVTVSVNAEGKVLNLAGANCEVVLFAVSPDSKVAFGDVRAAARLGLLGVSLPGGAEADLAYTVQLAGQGIGSHGPEGKLGISYGLLSGSAGVTPSGEVELGGGVGPQLVPEQYSHLGQLKLALEAKVSAPMIVSDLQWTSKHGVFQVAHRAAARIARMLAQPVACPYCSQRGDVSCRRCGGAGTVTCPRCAGALTERCPRCDGTGRVSCPPTQTCSRCGGSGYLDCGHCGGWGRVEVQVPVTRTASRQVPRQVFGGWDENGDPWYRIEYETEFYEVTEWETDYQSCPACGGSGRAGTCPECGGDGQVTCERCGGTGWVYCGRCDGTGEIPCPECDGTGVVRCPNCRGRPILCPLCGGRKEIGG